MGDVLSTYQRVMAFSAVMLLGGYAYGYVSFLLNRYCYEKVLSRGWDLDLDFQPLAC